MKARFEFLRRDWELEYRWPSGDVEFYSPADAYRVSDESDARELVLGFGWRDAFGQVRRRIIVFLRDPVWPGIEFVGTDSYASDRTLVWAMKKPEGNVQYGISESPHPDYLGLRMVPFRNHISNKRSFASWAVMVIEDQVEEILRAAWIRGHHRPHFV